MNTDSIGVPTRREPFFRTSDYCDGFCCFCTFTQHTQLILRRQLHIVYYKWDISSTPRTCTATLCLVKAPPFSFCRRHHWSRRVRSPARASASEAYLWTQIRLRFEASYNTRGPIRQRHLSLRKQNSFNSTRLGSPALVEGQWPREDVWRCGLVWKCMKIYETEKSCWQPAQGLGWFGNFYIGLSFGIWWISAKGADHAYDVPRCAPDPPCELLGPKADTTTAQRCRKMAERWCHDQGHQGDGHSSFSALHCSELLEGLEVNAAPDHVWFVWCARFVSRPERTCDMLQQMRWLGRLSGQPFHSNMLCWCPKNSDAGQELFPTDAKQARDLRESVWSTRSPMELQSAATILDALASRILQVLQKRRIFLRGVSAGWIAGATSEAFCRMMLLGRQFAAKLQRCLLLTFLELWCELA